MGNPEQKSDPERRKSCAFVLLRCDSGFPGAEIAFEPYKPPVCQHRTDCPDLTCKGWGGCALLGLRWVL